MKKIIVLIMLSLMLLSFAGCTDKNEELIEEATNEILNKWEEMYNESNESLSELERDGYLEIKNVRLVSIKDNNIDMFKDVECVIEYVLYTDYYGSNPYYSYDGIYDTVIVYKDGNMEVEESNPFKIYRARFYKSDYSDIIKEVIDYGTEFNKAYDLLN